MSVLSVNNLSKQYGNIHALRDVSFSVPEGSVFGILGPNGSGKTTTLATITDIIRPTSGSYQFFGETPTAATRKSMGTLLETPNFYHYLSGIKNLEIAAQIKQKGEEDIDQVLQMVNLTSRKDSKFSTYSLGMKQRLALASAMLGDPKVLIFDEPTNGLDPVGIAEIRQLIRELHGRGKTIIMASHLLDEVEKVCTHVAILKRGQLLASGEVNDILANEDILEVSSANPNQLFDRLQSYPSASRVEIEGQLIKIYFPVHTANPADLNKFCFEQGIVLNHLAPRKKSLEAKFFELTNN